MPFIAMLMFGVCVAVQSAICLQHNAIFLLDIELHAWVSWPSDGTPLYKTCGLKSGRGLHVKMATAHEENKHGRLDSWVLKGKITDLSSVSTQLC